MVDNAIVINYLRTKKNPVCVFQTGHFM